MTNASEEAAFLDRSRFERFAMFLAVSKQLERDRSIESWISRKVDVAVDSASDEPEHVKRAPVEWGFD
jgi:hypothetical protein